MSKSTYRVHVDDRGYVWYAYNDQMPVPSMSKVEDFVHNPPFTTVDTVRAIGCHSNVELLLRLYDYKLVGKLAALQVCTPAVCSATDRQSRPEIALLNTAQWHGWPASLGGWHEFGEKDFPSYYLAQNFIVDAESEHFVSRIGRSHVAWNALSFIPHLNQEHCFRLIGKLLDPRWFVDPEEPDKDSRLGGFLGLLPKTQYHVSAGNDKTVYGYDHCLLVMRTWKMGKPTSKEEYSQPGNFLWRIHAAEGVGYKADLRTSQVFMTYLRNVWLHELYKEGDGLFVPEYFFKTKLEAKAYREHVQRYQNIGR